MINFDWKPLSEIPAEHLKSNNAISPMYLVKCGEFDGRTVLGYTNYSFATNSWLLCCHATEPGIWSVQAWTDVEI